MQFFREKKTNILTYGTRQFVINDESLRSASSTTENARIYYNY